MEEKNKETEVQENGGSQKETEVNNNGGEKQTENITFTQAELDKRIQSETDKVRTEYSKKLKALEDKVKELTPEVKTEAEIDLEKRIAAIEAREAKIKMLDAMTENGIDHSLADYFKSDVDFKAFGEVYKAAVDKAVEAKISADGFKPNGHKNGETLTKEEFAKMSMAEKESLFSTNPDLYKALVGRK